MLFTDENEKLLYLENLYGELLTLQENRGISYGEIAYIEGLSEEEREEFENEVYSELEKEREKQRKKLRKEIETIFEDFIKEDMKQDYFYKILKWKRINKHYFEILLHCDININEEERIYMIQDRFLNYYIENGKSKYKYLEEELSNWVSDYVLIDSDFNN